jgi:1-acyl-sn-glycerol-3-phosphate acyltransferase
MRAAGMPVDETKALHAKQPRRADTTLHLILSIYTWVWLWFVSILGVTLMVPVSLVTRPWDPTRRIVGRMFRLIARTIAQGTPLWHFRALTPYPATLHGAYVVVSNHESHLDAFLLTFLPYEMKWLAKKVLFRMPFIGWGMALAGDIAVTRGLGSSIDNAMAKCRWYLARGMPVFIFPEGTRSTHEALLPFKDGAFRLALEAGCPVLPLAVAGTARGLAKNSLKFCSSTATVQVGTAIDTQALCARIQNPDDATTFNDAVTLLKEEARMQIATMRATLRAELGIVQAVPHASSGR